MKSNEYKCSTCGGIFEKGQTDEEAIEEATQNGFPIDEAELVCDDCYNDIMKIMAAAPCLENNNEKILQ